MIERMTLFELVGRKLDQTDQRHGVLTRNIANADTPGFIPRDVVEPDFRRVLAGTSGQGGLALSTTHAGHTLGASGAAPHFRSEATPGELKASGNAVSLDVEAGKLRSNSGQHRLATLIYGKYVKLLNLATGQGG